MVPGDGTVMGVEMPFSPSIYPECKIVLIEQADDSPPMLYEILQQEEGQQVKLVPLGQVISINRVDRVITLSGPNSTKTIDYERLIISPNQSGQPSDRSLWLNLLEKALRLQNSMPSKIVQNAPATTMSNRKCAQIHSDPHSQLIKTEGKTSERLDVPHAIEIQVASR